MASERKKKKKRMERRKVRGGFELFTAPNDKTSSTSASTTRERSSDCSIGWQCYFYNSPQPPYIPSPRRVLFLLAAFRERIKEKERGRERERKAERETAKEYARGKGRNRESRGVERWEWGVVSSLPTPVYSPTALLYSSV